MSDLVKDAVRLALREDRENLAAFVERQTDVSQILKCFDVFAEDSRGRGCEKLTGQDRDRVCEGSYRIMYQIQDDALVAIVVTVGHRRDVHPGAVNSRIHLTSVLVIPLASGAAVRRTGAGRARR